MRVKTNKLIVSMIAALIVLATIFNADMATNAAKIDYSPVFNSSYYSAKYPDLAAAGIRTEAQLLNHFVNNGMKEGRQGSAEFSVQVYRANYPDLNAAFGNNLPAYYMHYISSGKAEGRVASASTNATATAPAAQAALTPQQQVLELVNRDRANHGLGKVTMTAELNEAAARRAQEIVSTFSHTRPDGRSCFSVLSECGVSYSSCGENIAAGQRTAEDVERGWMNSPGHKANILNTNYSHIGVGYVTVPGGYGTYWVQIFTN